MRPYILLFYLLTFLPLSAQRITRHYQGESLSRVLEDLGTVSDRYDISFVYNELEDFTVSCRLDHVRMDDALRTVVGFYPVRIIRDGKRYFVECIHKTDRHLTGRILNQQGQPVAYANVSLLSPADSSLIGGGVSNEAGDFVIPVEQSPVLVRISYVGYKTVWRLCTTDHLGTIRLAEDNTLLRGLVVQGQMPILRREADRIVFDPRHIVGAISATDLLRRVPGVMVEDESLSLFGTNGVIFCINGREQHLGQKEMLQVLKSYPAADVDKIEVIQTPGARYSTEGNAGIINLIMKKKGNDYLGGSVGYAHTQYEEHGDEGNASLTFNRDKVQTSLNVAGTKDNTRYTETNTTGFDGLVRDNTNWGHIGKDHLTARWQLDYAANARLSLGTYALMSKGDRQLDVDGRYIDTWPMNKWKKTQRRDTLSTLMDRHEDTHNYALNAFAAQQLGDKDDKLELNLDYYHMTMDDHRRASGFSYVPYYYDNDIHHTVDNYSARLDATLGHFRLGSHLTKTCSERGIVHSFNEAPNSHNAYTYDETVWAAYLEYSRRFGDRWQLSLGERYEYTWTKGHEQGEEHYARTRYGRLLPTLHAAYTPNHDHAFSLSLSNRITRPNIINVNPQRVHNDIHHSVTGNEELRPNYFYKVMTGYTYKGRLSLDIFYAYEPHKMSLVSGLIDGNSVSSYWENSINEQDLGLNAFWYFDRLRWMNAILMAGLSYNKTTSDSHFTFDRSETLSYAGILQTTFFPDRSRKWTVNLDLAYSSREEDVARTLDARYKLSLGVQRSFLSDRLRVSATCRNLIASRITGREWISGYWMDFDNKFNYRQLHLTVTWNWGARLRHSRHHQNSEEMLERTKNDF